jgi:uncharacterized protein YdeI (YjbR/CyaY-like superfamily)
MCTQTMRRLRYPILDLASRANWRAWLALNHTRSTGVRLVIRKKDGRRAGVYYSEAVEEALCFGWIDSRADSLDDDGYLLQMTPRRPGSAWSPSNTARVADLQAQGLMASAGLARVETARQDGSWDALNDIEALVMPTDVITALQAAPTALVNWQACPASRQKQLLYWLASAHRPETRTKRLAQLVQRALDCTLQDFWVAAPKR